MTPLRRTAAIIASMLCPGAGHFVLGRFRRGVVFYLCIFGSMPLELVSLWLWLPLLLLVWAGSVADVARLTPRASLPGWRRVAIGWVILVVASQLGTRGFRAWFAEPFKVPSGSMIPTLLVGDQIYVNKFIYGLRVPWTDVKFGMDVRKPRRGEVAVFKFPRDPTQDFIKRIVAVEGDTIEIRDDQLVINGQPVPRARDESVPCAYDDFDEQSGRWQHRLCDAWREMLDGHTYTAIHDRGASPRSWPSVTVPTGQVFVMGDNRDNSSDSRYWGFVPMTYLRGRVVYVWWSWGESVRWKRINHRIDAAEPLASSQTFPAGQESMTHCLSNCEMGRGHCTEDNMTEQLRCCRADCARK